MSSQPRDPRVTLTNTAIDALQPGGELKDDRIPGLSVRAHRGSKSFLLYYRTKTGIQRRPKIGDCDLVSLSAARDIARTMLLRVAAGGDPVAERQAARAEPTLDALWERCERDYYNRGRSWDGDAKRIYRAYIAPRLGKIRARSLTYDDVADLHAALRAKPVLANRVIAVLSKMLNLAERWRWRDTGSNPCQNVERYREASRRRYATPDEIKAIGGALDALAVDPANTAGVAFLYLLMFSGARPSEIGRATPAMLERVERDGQVFGVLRLAQGKTGPRDVFLPPQAIKVLDRLPEKRTALAGRTTVPRDLWLKVRAAAGCDDLWARDLRRTFATVALSGGMAIGTVAELLGHKSVQTTKIYAKLMEDPAHAAAATVADRMDQMLGRGPSREPQAG